MAQAPGARSLRNVEKRKKKAKRAAPRKETAIISGNTIGARTRLKKLAGRKLAAKAAGKVAVKVAKKPARKPAPKAKKAAA